MPADYLADIVLALVAPAALAVTEGPERCFVALSDEFSELRDDLKTGLAGNDIHLVISLFGSDGQNVFIRKTKIICHKSGVIREDSQ